MNDYEKLLDLTESKLKLSENFFEYTKVIENDLKNNNFDDIGLKINRRQDIIDDITLLDNQFITLFTDLKETEDFEENIVKYPKLSNYISSIKNNFSKAIELDEKIKPIIENEILSVKYEIKKIKNNAAVNEKYGIDVMQKTEKANFGMFIDNKQ